MLNTKYIIINPENTPVTNQHALGNAWFVNTFRLVASPDEELAAINAFTPSSEAIIDIRYEKQLEDFTSTIDSSRTIELSSYKANELVYRYSCSSDQLAVFSEIFYPKGWNAYLDGEITDHFRANYILRSMVLPGGDHELVFRFEPESYFVGNKVSLAGSILLLILVAGSILLETRKRKMI
jgi:hypothetical protein